MVLPSFGPFRIRQGETIRAVVHSNKAIAVVGRFRILYDDGGEDDFYLIALTTGVVRAAENVYTNRVALRDGWVIGGQVSSVTSVERGQAYAYAFTIPNGSVAPAQDLVDILLAGYLYGGHTVRLGEHEPSGPAGGHGNRRDIMTNDPAVGAEIAAQTVPTNAVWLIRAFQIEVDVGAAACEPTVQYRNAANAIIAELGGASSPTGGATEELNWSLGTNIRDTGIVLNTALPWIYLDAGFDFITGRVTADEDYGVGRLTVEEWVLP